MTGRPRTRERQAEAGEHVVSWRDDPSLSSRPPFEPGNLAALRHGATSPRMVAPIAAERAARLPQVAPWTARDAFAGTREDLAWTEAQIMLLRAYIDDRGTLDGDGLPIPAQALHDKLVSRAQSLRTELGLTSQSLAKLLGTLSSVAVAGGDDAGLAALKAEGAEIIAARQRALVSVDDPDDPEKVA